MGSLEPESNEPEEPHLIASPESVERTLRSSGAGWVSSLIAGLLAGLVLGWAARGTVNARNQFAAGLTRYHDGGPTELAQSQGRRGWVIEAPQPRAPQKPAPQRSVPIPAQREVSKPGKTLPGLVPIQPGVPESVVTPLDMHVGEARIRTIVANVGGQVVSVRVARGISGGEARSFVLRVSSRRSKTLVNRIRAELGASALVEDPIRSSGGDEAPTELKSQEALLEQLRLKVRQARLDFYPDAPALKALESQYRDQIRVVDALRSSLELPVNLTVILVSTGN